MLFFSNLFKKRRKYERKTGQFVPLSEYVRIDNVARAAGVSYEVAICVVRYNGFEIVSKGGRRYVSKDDAIRLHSILCDEA